MKLDLNVYIGGNIFIYHPLSFVVIRGYIINKRSIFNILSKAFLPSTLPFTTPLDVPSHKGNSLLSKLVFVLNKPGLQHKTKPSCINRCLKTHIKFLTYRCTKYNFFQVPRKLKRRKVTRKKAARTKKLTKCLPALAKALLLINHERNMRVRVKMLS